MLRKLQLENYRCFQNHSVSLQPSTVVVGRNNAGKSTIVEALHLVAAVVNREAASFTVVPPYSDLGKFQRCIIPSITNLNIDFRTVFHRYGDPPAVLKASFAADAVVTVYVHPEGVYATIANRRGWVTTSSGFKALQIPHINILPQISPLQNEETIHKDDYIREHRYTRLSSRHFRNQIYREPDNFLQYKTLAEQTWRGLRVERVQNDNDSLSMLVTDGDFAAEAAWMGHGLQMWLQTVWFIAKTPQNSTVVLDEPDVYMHPDLQRKLFRLVRARFNQSIIATHSVEIMAESDPENILIINNKRRKSDYANTEPGVQVLIDRLGGVHNVHLARLWNAKKVLLFEGKDIGFLKIFHAKLFPDAEAPLDALPNLSIGGWGGWQHAIGSNMAFRNAVGDAIATYCILDSDYHKESEKQERQAQARDRGINLHIWMRKEIENYLLDPRVIARAIRQRASVLPPSEGQVEDFLREACEAEKDTVLDGIASVQERGLGVGGANKIARSELGARWDKEYLSLASGKSVLSRLSTWAREKFGVSVGAMTLVRAFHQNEIPDEVVEVVTSIENGERFDELPS